MMTSSAKAFDTAANDYDHNFTHSKTGALQRAQVLHYLKSRIKEDLLAETILEVNAGTGEDAIFLAQYCKHLLVTDISETMLQVSRNKLLDYENVSTQLLNAKDIETVPDTFHLIFSNFGGLNCLNPKEIETFIIQAHAKLKENGHLILVLLSSASWWEKFWGFISNNKKLRTRRQAHTGISTEMNGVTFLTYYYTPKTIATLATSHFDLLSIKPIGLFIPPTFLEHRVKHKSALLKLLVRLEQTFSAWPLLSNYADHYLIHLQKK